jgi:hypothetical protein
LSQKIVVAGGGGGVLSSLIPQLFGWSCLRVSTHAFFAFASSSYISLAFGFTLGL